MVDTVEKTYKEEDFNPGISESPAVLDFKVRKVGGFVKVVFRPSEVLNDGRKPSSIENSIMVITEIENKYGMQDKGYISRADIAIDMKRRLGDFSKIFRLFIECMSYSMGINESHCFETLFDKFHIGNLKIANRKNCLTIYNSEDKDRIGKTRIERRFLSRAKQKSDRDVLVEMTKSFLNEVTMAESFVEAVEEDYFLSLMKRKEETKYYYASLAEFLSREDKFFLTDNIFRMVYLSSGYVDKPSKYLYDYRQKRPQGLDFVKRKDFSEFIKIISDVLKDDLRASFFSVSIRIIANQSKYRKTPLHKYLTRLASELCRVFFLGLCLD